MIWALVFVSGIIIKYSLAIIIYLWNWTRYRYAKAVVFRKRSLNRQILVQEEHKVAMIND
jgi:hypothetical protein